MENSQAPRDKQSGSRSKVDGSRILFGMGDGSKGLLLRPFPAFLSTPGQATANETPLEKKDSNESIDLGPFDEGLIKLRVLIDLSTLEQGLVDPSEFHM